MNDIKTLIARADADADLAGSVVLTDAEWAALRARLTADAIQPLVEAARAHLLAFRPIATFREYKEAHAALGAALKPYYPELHQPL